MKQGGFRKKTIADVPLDGKVVLVRTDYNVPLTSDGEIQDDFRIRSSLPTLQALLERGCTVVIISHLGRPDGKRNKNMSLESVAHRLQELLGRPVKFVNECIGDSVSVAVGRAKPGSVLLLENLRFHHEEEADDPAFARALAVSSRAEYFVQDGFGVVHRAHASTSAITQYLPSMAGLLLTREYTILTGVIEHPQRPLVAVFGGAKVSDKIKMVDRFVQIADTVVVGGAMANNFLKYRGYPVGESLVEADVEPIVAGIYAAAKKKVGTPEVDEFISIPEDVAVADSASDDARRLVVDRREVAPHERILDIGPATMDMIDTELATAKTVVWNGTLGRAELGQFAHGSARLALYLATHPEITSVIGGGDTADFVLHWDAAHGESFTHISTGGGASLELLSGEPMPGINSLMDAR